MDDLRKAVEQYFKVLDAPTTLYSMREIEAAERILRSTLMKIKKAKPKEDTLL